MVSGSGQMGEEAAAVERVGEVERAHADERLVAGVVEGEVRAPEGAEGAGGVDEGDR